MASITKNEAFGIVQLEAMLRKKPIISTDIPGSGVSWVNKHNVTGLVVPPKDPQAIANAVKLLLDVYVDDKEKYERFSKNAYLRVKDKFTNTSMIKSFKSLYMNLLSGLT